MQIMKVATFLHTPPIWLAVLREAAKQQEAAAAELIELRKQAAESEAREVVAEKAERTRLWAEQEAVRVEEAVERAAARAVEDERTRVARAEGDRIAAQAKLERNKKHRAKIHNEILAALMAQGLNNPQAATVVEDIIAGKIPHVSIAY